MSSLIVGEDGVKTWHQNGQLHREDGPAIEWPHGEKHWYCRGRLHRENGPAVEYPNGSKFWYHLGQLHRETGPAIEWNTGTTSWYLNGIQYAFANFCQEAPLTDQQRTFLTIKYSELTSTNI